MCVVPKSLSLAPTSLQSSRIDFPNAFWISCQHLQLKMRNTINPFQDLLPFLLLALPLSQWCRLKTSESSFISPSSSFSTIQLVAKSCQFHPPQCFELQCLYFACHFPSPGTSHLLPGILFSLPPSSIFFNSSYTMGKIISINMAEPGFLSLSGQGLAHSTLNTNFFYLCKHISDHIIFSCSNISLVLSIFLIKEILFWINNDCVNGKRSQRGPGDRR